MKRGQITVYMIVGVVILILVVSLLYYRGSILKEISSEKQIEISSVPEQFKEIQTQIKDCTDKFVLDSIYSLSDHSGYLDWTNTKTYSFLGFDLPYAFYGKENRLLDIKSMEIQLSKNILKNLPNDCEIQSGNIEIVFGNIQASSKISETSVIVGIIWIISLQKGSIRTSIDKINLNYPLRVGKLRDSANEMINIQKSYAPGICTSCLAEIGQQNKVFVETIPRGNNIVFILTDLEQNEENPLKFRFVSDYGGYK